MTYNVFGGMLYLTQSIYLPFFGITWISRGPQRYSRTLHEVAVIVALSQAV